MKKTRQYVIGIMFVLIMAFAAGCGDGKNNTKATESAKPSQSAVSGESTEGGMANGPTNASDHSSAAGEESTGVLDGLADDIRNGAEDRKDGAERAVDDGTGSTTAESSAGQ